MSLLRDLAERCEDAETAGDELDLAIATWCYENGAVAGVNYDPQLWLIRNGPFTASIDAAMTLVPADWTMGRIFWPGYDNGKWTNHARVDLHHQFSSGGGPKVTAFAATPALALCAAALKARAA